MRDQVLRVNPIACDGHGLCAELFPERIKLDEWGYPIVDPTPIPPELENMLGARSRAARRSPSCSRSAPSQPAERGVINRRGAPAPPRPR